MVGDPDGQWLNNDTLIPLINQVYESDTSYLAGSCSPYDVKLAVVPNVQPGTTSLIPQQQGQNQPLNGLIKPRLILAKLAGTPDVNYRQMVEYDVLPNIPAGWPVWQGGWEWRAFRIWLTPFPQAMDLQVRGDFMPPPLRQDADIFVTHPNMAQCTAYGAAALAAVTVGNQGWQTAYTALHSETLDDISAQLVRQQSALTFRVGRMNRGGKGRNRGYSGGR